MARLLFFQEGWIVQDTTVVPVNILVKGERIAAVGPDISPPTGAQIVDARGLLVLPGLIDAHVHLREPGGEHKEDLTTGTSAALAGGVTTVLAMPNTAPPLTDKASLARATALAERKAVCDWGFFIGATPHNARTAAKLAQAVGLKMYMGSSTGPLLVQDFGSQYTHFKTFPPHRPIVVHAENEAAVQWFARHGQRRPPICAVLETAHALALAEHLGRRVHICHLSTAQELALVHAARERGVQVTCEVAPHHLFLNQEAEWKLGPLAKMNPPLRTQEDVDALWAHLDWIDIVASDHAPHTLKEKHKGMAAAPAGVPGLETTLRLLLTAAGEGRLMLSDVVRLTSSGPAQVFGLARKGHIAPGYDADLVLVDYEAQGRILNETLLTKCGWSPFDGWPVKGEIKQVYLRGRLAYSDGVVRVEPGYGKRVRVGRR